MSTNFDSAARAKFKNGECTFFTDCIYFNDAKDCWRRFIVIMRIAQKEYNYTKETLYNNNSDTTYPAPLPDE